MVRKMIMPTLEFSEVKHNLRALLPDLRERYHVESLAVFGSYARGDEQPDSDLDVLVSFSEVPGLLRFIELEQELSDRLGVSVDLVEEGSLKSHVDETVRRDAQPI